MFSIDVPISDEIPLPISLAVPQPGTGNPLPGRRLLVLDNEVSILQSMSALLGQWGCEVVTATDESSALAALHGPGAGTDSGGLSPRSRGGGL